VSEAASASPISSPFEYTAVPSAIRRGTHSRTTEGSEGCMIAMPTPIAKVAAKSVRASGAAPRSADPAAVRRMPPTSTRNAPKRAIRTEPGTAANENSSTGRLASAPT